ncbi:Pentatricopeptide repeat-containing protein [Abeliophyllum distichum]|uniref:Pentatricopeptide repeat-containing protein n=1 Tax=Abeliophyllum distichum TaxID=126358 RepID=A0ABD1QEH0_9LAMI
MIKILRLWPRISSNAQSCSYYNSSGVPRVFSYCTKAPTSSVDKLFKRISSRGDPRLSIVPILDQWVDEGRIVDQAQLKIILKLLRKFKRYSHALQVFEWTSDTCDELSSGDIAVRLDLISRVHGIEDAEKYFTNVPSTKKTFKVYGALLSCYAYKRLLDKAENIMQILRESGYKRSLSYNVMLSLYAKSGKYKEFEALLQEMEQKSINGGKETFYIQLNVYAAKENIEGIENLITKMKANPGVPVDWHVYAIAAKGYFKAGRIEKSSQMLKEVEKCIQGKSSKFGYRMLLTMHANLGNRDEVYHVWNLIKNERHICNTDYSYVVSSLVKLNEIDGAERIWEEWESVNKNYDFQIPNLLINAYIRRDLLGKAEAFVSRLVENGKKPPVSTWDFLASGYVKNSQMEKAVEAMKEAILADQGTWKLNRITLTACINFLRKNGDEKAEEFIRLLIERGLFSVVPSDTSNDIKDASCAIHAFDEGYDVEEGTSSVTLDAGHDVKGAIHSPIVTC